MSGRSSLAKFARQYAAQVVDATGKRVSPPRVAGISRSRRDLEGELALMLQAHEIGGWIREHRFHATRRWRFDFAWPAHKFAVELDGGVFMAARTGHTSHAGLRNDYERDAAALLLEWVVFRVNGTMGKKQGTIDVIRRWVGDGGASIEPEQTKLI